MTGTRASTIRAAIIAAVEAATNDTPAHMADVFTHVEDSFEGADDSVDRVFRVRAIAPPIRITASSCDLYEMVFQLVVDYNGSQEGLSDRMTDDAERIFLSLDRLDATVDGLERIDVDPTGFVGLGSEAVEAQFNIGITYRLDSQITRGLA